MHCTKVSVLWWFCASLNHNLAYILKVRCELKRVWKKYEDCPSETERCDFKKEYIPKKKKMNNKKEPPGDSIVQDLESCRKDMELLVCIRYRCSGCNVCQWRRGDPTVTVLVFWVCRGEQIFGTFRALVPQLWLMSDRGMRCYDNWHAMSSDGGNWIECHIWIIVLSAVVCSSFLTIYCMLPLSFQNDGFKMILRDTSMMSFQTHMIFFLWWNTKGEMNGGQSYQAWKSMLKYHECGPFHLY